MMGGIGSKADIRQIVHVHRASYVNAATGQRSIRDHLEFEVFPFLCAVGLGVFDVRLRPAASVGLLTIAGLLSAFLFGVMLQVSDRALNWADAKPAQGKETSEHASYLTELAANAGYASLVSVAAAIAFVVAATTFHHPWPLRISSAVGLALGLHLILTLLLVMKRVFALTEQRLNQARAGATGPDDSKQRRAA
jgi:uncharacterized membrane protein YedE/YeeE